METHEPASARWDALVLAGLVVLVGATCLRSYQPYTFIFRDGSFYAQTNRSIARALTLRQEAFQPRSWYDGTLPWYRNLDVAWSNVSVGSRGEWYPKHSYLMPLASTPFYVVLGMDGLLVFNALAMVLALFFGYRLAARFSSREAAAVVLFCVSSSPLVPYLTYAYSHDVFCAALVTGGGEALAARRPGFGGLLLGISIAARITNLFVAAPMGLALVGRDWRTLRRAIAFGGVPLLAHLAANWWMFGSPLLFSYQRVLTVEDGRPVVTSWVMFGTPLAEGLRRFFTSSPEGELWQMAPIPVVAYLGAFCLLRRARALAVALIGSFIAFVLVFAKYRYGGARFFMPWLALSVVPGAALMETVVSGTAWVGKGIAPWIERNLRRVAVVTGVGCVLVVALAWWSQIPKPSASMARDVEHLRVHLDEIPCDYFNMTHQKWECSHLDPGGRHLVGLALGEECPSMDRPVLYIPVHPAGRTRTVRWLPGASGESIRVMWTWQGRAPGSAPAWSIRIGDGEDIVMPQAWNDVPTSFRVAGPIGPDREVVLTLPGGRSDAVLCVSVEVEE